MNKERELVRVFVKVHKELSQISYHLDSLRGPKVNPRRFYPSRLVKLVEIKEGSQTERAPDPYELRNKAPDDRRINAYVLGDRNHFRVQTGSSTIEAEQGPHYRNMMETTQHFGIDELNQNIVSITYCMLSERDLGKRRGNQ